MQQALRKRCAFRIDDMTNESPHVVTDIYDRLYSAYGPQGWWPADSAEEVMIGAVLTQNTAWRNVEKAIESLACADALSMARIHALPMDKLESLIRPAGTFRVKARRLKALAHAVMEDCAGSLRKLFEGNRVDVRSRLLSISGIGPETADAIMLYAGGIPIFVIDAYARRVLVRHGIATSSATYGELQDIMEAGMPPDEATYNEYHALIVEVGKRHCRKRANCDGCPLEPLPHETD